MARPYLSSPLPLKLAALDRSYRLRFMRDHGPVDRLVPAGEAIELPPNGPVLLPAEPLTTELLPTGTLAAEEFKQHYFCENCHVELRADAPPRANLNAKATLTPTAESNVCDHDTPTDHPPAKSRVRLNCPRCHGSTEFT